jgi:hypothetical protein
MESLVIECLYCRTSRLARRDRWAPVLEVTETERGKLLERKRDERRLPSVA